MSRYLEAQAAQILAKIRSARCKGDLGQKPEGMQKRGVVRGRTETCLGRVRGKCRYHVDLGAEAQLFDDLAPLPRLRKYAQSYMAHIGIVGNPRRSDDAGRKQGEQGRKQGLMLTWRLPANPMDDGVPI